MYKILGWKSVRDCLPLEPSWWWGRGTKPIQRGWAASSRKHRNTYTLWYNTLQGRMVFSWYKLASHCWETGKPIKNNKGREATVLFSMVSQTQTLSDWLPQLQQLQVTDGNYTVAWLVADEDDGAGYYEDDDDDQVKHINIMIHLTCWHISYLWMTLLHLNHMYRPRLEHAIIIWTEVWVSFSFCLDFYWCSDKGIGI